MADGTGVRGAGTARAAEIAGGAVGEAGPERRGAAPVGGPHRKLTAAQRTLFLETLATTGNVMASAAATGVVFSAFYKLRDRDEAFAADWAIAVECGVQALKSWLVAIAMGQPSPPGFDPILAMTIVQQRRSQVARHRHDGRTVRTKQVPIGDVQKEVLRRLAVLARRKPRASRAPQR